MLAVVLSFLINQAHPATIAYGARTNLLHFPLIFIMARVLTWEDVIKFRKSISFTGSSHDLGSGTAISGRCGSIINTAAGGVGSTIGNFRWKSAGIRYF